MANKKIEMRPKGTGDYGDVLFPKTSSDMVIDEASGKTVQAMITETNSTVASQGTRLGTAETSITSQGTRIGTAETNITATTNKTNTHVADAGIHVTASEKAFLQAGGSDVPYGFETFAGSSKQSGATRTFTIPDGVKTIWVSLFGGGGGGGGCGYLTYSGGAGGSGAIAYRIPVPVTTNRSASIIIGSGGTGGTGSGYGRDGGATQLKIGSSDMLSVAGGEGGYYSTGNNTYSGSGGSSGTRNGLPVYNFTSRMNSEISRWINLPFGMFITGQRPDSIESSSNARVGLALYGDLAGFIGSFPAKSPWSTDIAHPSSGGSGSVVAANAGGQGNSGYAIIEWGL